MVPTFLAITGRLSRQIYRNKLTIVILIALPGFMILAFYFAFSSVGFAGTITYPIVVINNDEGLTPAIQNIFELGLRFNRDIPFLTNETINNGFAAAFIDLMGTTKYPGESDTSVFNIKVETDETETRRLIENRNRVALVIFPKTFSNVTLAAVNNAYYFQNNRTYIDEMIREIHPNPDVVPDFPVEGNSTIEIIGDGNFLDYQVAEMLLDMFFSEFQRFISSLNYPTEITVNYNQVELRDYSVFDQIVPGLYVIGILMQGSVISAFMLLEIETPNRTIERMRLSLIEPWEYILGIVSIGLFITPFQIAVLMGMSFILGFQPEGDIIQGFIVLWVSSLFSLGLAFMASTFFSTAGASGQILGFFVTPLAFASGAFMPVPPITILEGIFPTATGELRDLVLWDILPSTHAVNALHSILFYNFSVIDVFADFFALFSLSLILLVMSIVAYSWRHFSGDI